MPVPTLPDANAKMLKSNLIQVIFKDKKKKNFCINQARIDSITLLKDKHILEASILSLITQILVSMVTSQPENRRNSLTL